MAGLPVLVAIALALPGCGGGDDEGFGALAWEGEPRVFTPQTLPGDRILTGTVSNDSLEPVELTASDLKLEDADGDRVEGSAIFLSSFVHPLYPPTRAPSRPPESELRRTGRTLRLEPGGDRAPLTISWHEPSGSDPPVSVEYPGGSLPIPGAP